jgi:hypothetical protein
VTSIVAGTGISISGATGVVTVSATGTSFPGFGGAPPQIASASAAGAAGTASRSDHNHAADIPAYNPSLAGMQAGGIIQQTYSAPTATPAVLTMVAGQMPFGAAAGGVLTQAPEINWDNTNKRFNVLSAGASGSAATNELAQFNIIDDASGIGAISVVRYQTNNTGSTQRLRRARGTSAAPAVVVAGDIAGSWAGSYMNTALAFVTSGPALAWSSDPTSVVGTTVPSRAFFFANAGSTIGTNPWGGTNLVSFWVDSQQKAYLGSGAGAAAAANNGLRVRYDTAIASAAGATLDAISFEAATSTISGAAAITTPTGYNYITIAQPAYSSGGAVSIALAATLSIAGPPVLSGGIGISNAIALYVQQGQVVVGRGDSAGPQGSIRINSNTGVAQGQQSIGGGGTAALYVADPFGAGAASIAVDDYIFAQNVIGYTNLNLTNLQVGSGTGHVLNLCFNMDRSGAASVAAIVDGTVGTIQLGPTVSVVCDPSGNVALGGSSLAAAATNGFAYMSRVVARPTGAPTAFVGQAPFAVDLTTGSGHALWVRDSVGAQWEPIPTFIFTQPAGAGAAVITNLPAGFGTTAKWWVFHDSTGTPTVIPYFQ